jgi:uncharacterized protein YjiS (DUF1127 family)
MFGIGILHAIQRWQRQARVRDELYAMDDRQLADIGLSRGDIEQVVRGGSPRQNAAA